MTASDAHRAIDAVWRIESPRLIAGLTRMVRDVGIAEDLAQDALVAALQRWPETGVPEAFARGLFDKFFRIKRGTSHGREGVGLGLALCKAVVDAQGGRIGFTNAPPLTPARCFYTGNCCIRCGDLSMARKRSICGH